MFLFQLHNDTGETACPQNDPHAVRLTIYIPLKSPRPEDSGTEPPWETTALLFHYRHQWITMDYVPLAVTFSFRCCVASLGPVFRRVLSVALASRHCCGVQCSYAHHFVLRCAVQLYILCCGVQNSCTSFCVVDGVQLYSAVRCCDVQLYIVFRCAAQLYIILCCGVQCNCTSVCVVDGVQLYSVLRCAAVHRVPVCSTVVHHFVLWCSVQLYISLCCGRCAVVQRVAMCSCTSCSGVQRSCTSFCVVVFSAIVHQFVLWTVCSCTACCDVQLYIVFRCAAQLYIILCCGVQCNCTSVCVAACSCNSCCGVQCNCTSFCVAVCSVVVHHFVLRCAVQLYVVLRCTVELYIILSSSEME